MNITEIASITGQFSPTVKALYLFAQEMDWATFWATFSQTHLVTLAAVDREIFEGFNGPSALL
jgi:hypothetical protein